RFLVVGRAAPATGDAGVFEEPLQRGVLVGRDVTGEDVGEAVGQVVGEEDTAYGLHRVGRKDGQRVRAGEVVDDAGHAGHEVGTVSVAQAALEIVSHLLGPRRAGPARHAVEGGVEVPV